MATILLTAVGSAIAGPLGGALGALVGQRVDQALLGPKGRQGARLADLSVQSSSYGASIPRIYGRMRVSGTVIWATDLREERRKVSQGKGRPKATVYSYSASFAVLLSGRVAGRIGRIWADGKLLRGAAGDFKVETGFRFHTGTADQPVDPLIASVEGASAPAYRGRAYAVFEDMALESFGNRIPMLSFEVIADEGPVTVADIVRDVAGVDVDSNATVDLGGYVADGASVASALSPLEGIVPLHLRDDGLTVAINASAGDALPLAKGDLLGSSKPELSRSSDATLPVRMALGFADIDRDYQAGLQSMDLHIAGRAPELNLPAALSAGAAQTLVRDALLRSRLDGQLAEVRVPLRCLPLWTAGAISLGDQQWRIRSIRFEAMSLSLQLAPLSNIIPAAATADGGRSTVEPDLLAGQTVLVLAELPYVQDVAATSPLVVAAAAGTGPGWRSAALSMRTAGQSEWLDVGSVNSPAVIGTVTHGLRPASPHLLDLENKVTVQLLHDSMSLLNADDAALMAGANMALVGEEVVQFGRAERMESGVWQLSRLLRGRRGSEGGIGGHGEGERFLLLDVDTLMPLTVAAGTQSLEVMAKGLGDAQPVSGAIDVTGRAIRPLPPVHVSATELLDGGVHLHWIRRSREGWPWLDGVDAPLSEEKELYHVTVSAADMRVDFETEVPRLDVPASLFAEFRTLGADHFDVAISQIGRFGISAAHAASFPL